MTDLLVTCRDPSHDSAITIATMSYELWTWLVHPARCDLRWAKKPREGYSYRCKHCRAHVSVSRDSLHDALRRIHAHNQNAPPDQQIHDLSIQGLLTLHRTPGAGIQPPGPPSEGGGFLMPGKE